MTSAPAMVADRIDREAVAGIRPWVLSLLRCPVCQGSLRLVEAQWATSSGCAAEWPPCLTSNATLPVGHRRMCSVCVGYGLARGTFNCQRCGAGYEALDGVVRLRPVRWVRPVRESRLTAQTASRYGYIWGLRSKQDRQPQSDAHIDQVVDALQLPMPSGLILDAGCGSGLDLARLAAQGEVAVIGLELSDHGCTASLARIAGRPHAAVLQGDLTRLPLANGVFDWVYSYGVLHHLTDAEQGMRELVRVTKPGGRVAIYLYEDFIEREAFWRWLLAAANSLRAVTVQLPRPLLYALCMAAAPVTFVCFTLPHRLLRAFAATRPLAQTIPFRHASSPFSLAPDLYDRFAAPIERRFTRGEVLALCARCGLQALSIVRARGWMVTGMKPIR